MARIELVWFVFVVEMNRVMGNDILLFFVRCECFLAFFCLVLLHLDIEHLERVLPFFLLPHLPSCRVALSVVETNVQSSFRYYF